MAKNRSKARMLWAAILSLPLVLAMNACGDGGTGNASLFALFVGPAQTIDGGQTTTVTASIVNDSTPGGATFTVTGGGTLATPTTTTDGTTEHVSVKYTAPLTATVATVTATSVHTPSQSYSVVITVNAALTITTTSLPVGSTGTTYSVTPAATGGTGTLTWSVASGTLPAGLSLNAATGTISGTPTTAATYVFTLAVTDSAATPSTAVATYSVTINPPLPVVTATVLPTGVVGVAYSQQLAYTGGGTGTATWALASGTLPAGLTLSASGLLSGSPTTAANYSFSVTVTVGTQTSAAVAFTVQTVTPVVITTTTLPNAHVNVAYSQQLSYTGGTGTPSWAVVSGALPSGFTLSTSGLLSGSSATVSTTTFGVAVTVGTQTSATKSLTLTVLSTQITSAATARGEVGLPFAFQVTALGGTSPYTYSLATGSNALPGGLTINASTGLISGTPTTTTGSPFSGVVVQAKDSLGAVGTQSMTFTIVASRGSASNGELSGQYAFLLSGFDGSGNPVASAGTFTANGTGGIAAGVVDTNGTAMTSASTNVALTASTYALGVDGRGQVTLTTAAGSTTYALAINALSAGLATGGSLTEFDASGRRLTGLFVKQATSAFTVASINKGFAFGLYGYTANSSATALGQSGTIGEVQFAGVSAVTSSELLTSASGGTPVVPTAGTLTVGTNGRGTLALVLPGTSGTMNFAVYVVSASQMLLLSTDAASGTAAGVRDLVAGQALVQTVTSGSFTAASLNGTSVFHEEKLTGTTAATYAPDVQVGVYTFDGVSAVTGTEDRNAAGVVTQAVALAGTYSVAANGRVTAYVGAYGLGGCLDCAKPVSAFYITGSGQGFLLDFATTGGVGGFEPQTTSSFTATSLSGSYSLGTDRVLTSASVPESGLLTATGTGTVTGLLDQASAGVLAPDTALSATDTVSATGRVVLVNGSANVATVYMVSPTRGLWLDTVSAVPGLVEVNHQ